MRHPFPSWPAGLVALASLALALVPVGCREETPAASQPAGTTTPQAAPATPTQDPNTLTVAVAASLADVSRELAEAFRASPSNDRRNLAFEFNVGASDALALQIEQGAPVDVFLSADPAVTDRLAEAKAIDPDSRASFAGNVMLLIATASEWTDERADPRAFGAAADDRIQRLAIGSPQVPAGRYAEETLRAAGVWETLQPRLVFGEDARQVLDYALQGEVDAAIVYGTDAIAARGTHRVIARVPLPNWNHVAAVTTGSDNQAEASEFVAYLLTDEARAILRRRGFIVD